LPIRKSVQSERKHRTKVKSVRKRSWNTKEVSELYDVSRPTLVRWVDQGLVTVSKRTPAGTPVWFECDLIRLQEFLLYHKPYAKERRKAEAA
jgi:hypothetical protein